VIQPTISIFKELSLIGHILQTNIYGRSSYNIQRFEREKQNFLSIEQ
jgi:hypothetical protein